jgi:hypothetical protein
MIHHNKIYIRRNKNMKQNAYQLEFAELIKELQTSEE